MKSRYLAEASDKSCFEPLVDFQDDPAVTEHKAYQINGVSGQVFVECAGQSHLNLLVGSGVFSLCKGLKSPH